MVRILYGVLIPDPFMANHQVQRMIAAIYCMLITLTIGNLLMTQCD